MPDFYNSNLQDEDEVEITDLDSQNDGSSASLSLGLLKLIRKIPLFVNSRTRSTAMTLLTCVIMLLFLVQPGLPDIPRQASSTSVLARFNSTPVHSPLSIIGTPSAKEVTWIRISNVKVVFLKLRDGTMGWHHCIVQHSFTLPNYAHPTVVICI